MKKLLSLVLICAMGFGMISCVESEESQSVEALRNAKAEQLKALVNLYNAQAEAEKIIAEAEAAYNNAQAAYKEEELAQLKEKYALELESLIAKYEASLMESKYNKAKYEKQLMDELAKIEKAAEAELIALYTKYSDYSAELNKANGALLEAKVNLAKVEAEIVTVKEAAEIAIAEQEEIIAEQEEIIANNKAELAIYNEHAFSDLNADSLYLEYRKAYAEWKNAELAYFGTEEEALRDAKKEAVNAYNELTSSVQEFNFQVSGNDIINATDDNEANKWPTNVGINNPSETTAILAYNVNESLLESWKQDVTKTDLEDGVASAEEALEKAEAALEAFKGFEADFEKANAAREAIYAYDQAYEKYDMSYETVEHFEAVLENEKTVQDVEGRTAAVKQATTQKEFLEKVDLSKLKAADMDEEEWDTTEWEMSYELGEALNALKSGLTNLESKQADEKSAQDAVDALSETATEPEIKTVTDALADAQKAVKEAQDAVTAAYKKAVYEAGVILVNRTNELEDANLAIKDAEDDLADAKENKKALEDAYAAAKIAMATLDEIFNEDSAFAEFWKENGFGYYFIGKDIDGRDAGGDAVPVDFNKRYFLLDANNDNIPDLKLNLDGTVSDGTYMLGPEYQWYSDFAAASAYYYLSDNEGKYLVPDYDFMVAHYTTQVAQAKDDMTDANNNLAKANEWKSNWDAKEKELRDFVAEKNEEIKAVQALVDAYNEATEVAEAAKEKVDELESEQNAIRKMWGLAEGINVPDDGTGVSDLIEAAENAIEAAENANKDAEDIIKVHEGQLDGTYNWTASIPYKENLIAGYKANIEELTAKVELYTKLVENAKAALDAAMSSQNAE